MLKPTANGDYNFTGNGRFKLNDDFITMGGGERELKVKVKNGKIQSIDGFTDEDVVKVSKSGNIRINGQKITLTANQDMDMYGKPARASGTDVSGDSSGDSGTAESGDKTKVAGETEELTKTKSDLEYKSQDVDDTETETADFTITAKNVDADAVTFELVQKVLGTDKQEVDNFNGEIKLDGQPPVITAENQIDTDAPKISNVNPAANEPVADKQITIEIPAIELFDANEIFDASYKIFTPQEKTRLDTSETSDNFGVEYLQNLQLEEILPAKNIGADFVLNSEFKFNATLADSSQCRKQELIDFERKIQGSEMDRQ